MIFAPTPADATSLAPLNEGCFTLLNARNQSVGTVSYFHDEKGRWTEKQEGRGREYQVTRYFPGTEIVSSTTEKRHGRTSPLGLRTERRRKDGSLSVGACCYYGTTANTGSSVRPLATLYLQASLWSVQKIDRVRFSFGSLDHKNPSERADAQVRRATFFRRNWRRISGQDVFHLNTRKLAGAPPVPLVRPG